MGVLGSHGETLAAAPATQPAATSPARPNILLIISDEHNARVMGAAGDKVVRTSNLDALAQRGVVFDNCYCNSPLCVPSRHSMISGKYVSRVNAWSNTSWLPSDDIASLPRVLTAAGYDALLCGKMHMDATRKYGFTEVGGKMNQGHATGLGSRRRADDLAPTKAVSGRFDEFHVGKDSPIMSHDRRVTAGAAEFLKNRQPGQKPFFMIAGYLAPHFPLIVPPRYHEAYRGRVAMPHIPPGHLESLPRNYQHLRIGFQACNVPEETVRRGRELYHGLTQWVDEQIGELMAALARSHVADNTIVIYTSDHGENMGEHGLWWKNCMYEQAARVPLIVSYPPRWPGGQRRAGACSLLDVVRTVVDLAGAKAPDDWNGQAMTPWLDDAHVGWKDAAVSQYYAHHIASGFTMYRSGDHKYVYHARPDEKHEPQRELYDLRNDPGEFHNLAGEASQRGRIAAMHEAMVKEIGEEPDATERRSRADLAKGYGRERAGRGEGET
ncbi:MAG: sulfatase-like hydrolase/transferase [Planctomycetota bacterium]|nr:sulfatase-like hydrolase/transferase [Planctomycetota bacterium]